MNFNFTNNELVPMSRRYPDLCGKVLRRDSKIARKIMIAWDIDKNHQKAFDIFIKESKNLSDERYWEIMRSIWIIHGSVKTSDTFRILMQSSRPQRFYFNSHEDAKALRELPEVFTVWRACDLLDNGISWTTSKEYAEQYQRMYNKDQLIGRTVNKKEVFAYIRRNLENEIIIL